jgi:PAS domain S-box-containing protein
MSMSPQYQIILIVDDAPEDRAACRRYLQQDPEWEYTILEAETGERALEMCLESPPDCVLLDYHLPDMDGLEVLVALPAGDESNIDLPVVMLTGTDDVSLAVEAMKAGAQDFINKNRLTPIDLQRAVRNAIDRVALRRELREKDQQFRTLTETIPQLVWISTQDGQFNYLSSRWADFTGERLDRGLGSGWTEIMHPEDVARAREAWELSVASESIYDIELRLRRADGSYRWHLARALPMRDAAGQVTSWCGTCTDIEERKQAERERERMLHREQQLREQAETANRLKDEFLATISHELRTPLNSINGWAKMLRTGQLSSELSARALETIERSAKSQNQLINDLLDVSSIITGKMRLNVAPVLLGIIIEAAVDTVRPAADAKDIRLVVALDPAADEILCDAERLQQVVWNLLSNAIKFAPKGGRVDVRLDRVGSQVEISVADNGPGIKPEFIPYVFDRFRQEDGGTTRQHGGLGLGLAIVRHLVELHGGTVHASSEGLGRGALFTIVLPVVPLRTLTSEEKSTQEPTRKLQLLSGVRVLLVDDDADGRDLIAIMLTQDGAEVRTAGSVREAMSALDVWQPHAVISDIGMPEEDGYQLIEQLRAWERKRGEIRLPAVALTAYARPDDRLRALSAGYQAHVPKPVGPTELITVMMSVINKVEI